MLCSICMHDYFAISILSICYLKPFLLLWRKSKWQNISIYKFKSHLIRKTFLHFYKPKSIKTALPTDKYRSVCKLKFPNLDSNEFADLQVYIFCRFDFCHNRRNGFCSQFFKGVCTVGYSHQLFINQMNMCIVFANV
jgi:hypothetical protein